MISDIVTVLAIIAGPAIGVLIGQWLEARKRERQEKLAVLTALMKTRRGSARRSPEHVGALNLIQLLFNKYPSVIQAYEKHVKHLNTPAPSGGQQLETWVIEGDSNFLELLAAIATAMSYRFDKRDLESFGVCTGRMARSRIKLLEK